MSRLFLNAELLIILTGAGQGITAPVRVLRPRR
jgi:hypothetical protein